MKASAAEAACVVALVGIAVLHQTRKTSNQSAHVLQAERVSEPNSAAACNGVLNNPVLVQNILDLVVPGQHLYIAAISSLFNQCYAQVRAAEFDGFDAEHTNIRVLVGARTTRLSEVCQSWSRLFSCRRCWSDTNNKADILSSYCSEPAWT
jgi:hypothetical protein